jgi:hypothetical protein
VRRGAPPGRVAAPPLWLWAGVAALVLAALAASLPDYFDSEVTELELTRVARRERVRSFAREVAGEPRAVAVIALGDSAMRYATRLDDDMEAYWRAELGRDFQFLRLSGNAASLGTFVDLFEEILAARPDVLVLQASLLRRREKVRHRDEHRAFQTGVKSPPAYDRRRRISRILGGTDAFRHQQFFARRYLGSVGLGGFAEDDWAARMARRELREGCDTSNRDGRVESFLQKYPPDFDHRIAPLVVASAAVLVERAAEIGVTVAITEIPFGQPMERLAGVQARRAEARAFATDATRSGSLQLWRVDRSPPPEHYCDWTHMSEAGRDAFSLWLGQQLAGLPRPGPRS